MNIINSSAFMKSEPSDKSPLETECLFGESIEILDEYLDWVYCKLITDNYIGWVKKTDIGRLTGATHRVLAVRTFVFQETDEKSCALLFLPLGSRLVVEDTDRNWAKIFFIVDEKKKTGYVPKNHIININKKVRDWVKKAQELEGVPYRWGGRNTIGIDCSALLQLAYQTYGESIPRNTSEQVQLKKPQVHHIKNLNRGCVVFWNGHVGIMIDKVNCIHANAFHMKTITEPLIDIINRMDKDHQIVKMMNFN